ncbi:MAG TPA: anti-sigma regulatory factor [Candidatus Binatia bacterium]|nr:anti-sigma regulatory factor [Candidatus Binatia bacterium]
MATLRSEVVGIRVPEDIVRVRQIVREWSIGQKFSLVEQTKMITAASELARNTLEHGGGGEVRLEALNDGPKLGLRLTFTDRGPGVADVEQALRDGYSTSGGMGLGLGGSRRLVNDFKITSRPGEGTTVVIARWR